MNPEYTINLRSGKVYSFFKSIGATMARFRSLERYVDGWPNNTTIRREGKVLAQVFNGKLSIVR
jgi:hypothetical protein